MTVRQEVVVVDGLPETTEVLRAMLEPRGIRVRSSSSTQLPDQGAVESARVLVIHDHSPTRTNGSRVLIGRISPNADVAEDCRSLPQPFHYADLIAAIDAVVQRPVD